MTNSDNLDRELGWDDEIEKESDFILLKPGDYNFEITKFERARHEGSANLPPCNKAIVTLKIETDEGDAFINNNLFLHTKTEGFLSAFFISIGQKKKGEKLKMDWNEVVGAKGKCKVSVRKWISKQDGQEYQNNEIKQFYPAIEQNSKTNFTPGQF